MVISNQQLLDSLINIRHPEKKKSIVDLGMIRDIEISNDRISFTIQSDKLKVIQKLFKDLDYKFIMTGR